MSQPTIRTEIRLQLLRASDRLRMAATDLDEAIEAFDRGDFWDGDAADSRMNADVASSQIQTARGMAMVASMVPGGAIR